jgi:hypothetical protein
MPQYRLRFFRGPASAENDRVVDLPDDDAAFALGKKMCVAMGREPLDDSEPAAIRVEIFSESGQLLFKVAATIEIIDSAPARMKPRIVN